MEGYKANGQPDTGWWFREVIAGQKDRDNKCHADRWGEWRSFYRSNFREGIFTKNIFFQMRRTMVPRIYFRNPSLSVVPKKAGPRQTALAMVMQRVFNSLVDSMGVKAQMKKAVDEAFITGSGILKLGFGAEFTPTPESNFTQIPISESGHRNEFRSGIIANMPWLLKIPTSDFVLPVGSESIDNSYFHAHWVTRYMEDVMNDPRLNKFKRKKLHGGDTIPESWRTMDGTPDKDFNTERDQIKLLEIRDRRNRKVIIMAPYETDDVLYFEDDDLQTYGSSPFYIYTPNEDDENVWGVSDSKILAPYQEQMNEINTKMFIHARASLVKFIVKKGIADERELEKMTNDEIFAFIRVSDINGIQKLPDFQMPTALMQERQEIMQEVREVMGMNRNSLGDFQARSHGPTATEVQAVKASSELRIDERRDMLSDILIRIFRDVQQIVFRHWTSEQVIDVVGPDGHKVWVEFTGEMLKEGDYDLKIEPDSAVPETKEVRFSRAQQVYNQLIQDPFNVVDKKKVTEYFVRNIPGVGFEDLMNQSISGDPIGIDQLSNQISQSPQSELLQ